MHATLNEGTRPANAASEDRTHDLRIMRPTRCQLRYRRRCEHFNVFPSNAGVSTLEPERATGEEAAKQGGDLAAVGVNAECGE